MSLYMQYHNYDREGLPLGDNHGIHTSLKHVLKATGGQVFLIFGIGKPRRYYLWDSFTVAHVDPFNDNGKAEYRAHGPGWDLAPPQLLQGEGFDAFKKSCANFVGFRNVDGLPFAKTLKRLAEKYRTPGSPARVKNFVDQLGELLPDDELTALANHFYPPGKQAAKQPSGQHVQTATKPSSKRSTKKVTVPKAQTRALSIRQPHAEAILRGVKKIEYRSAATKFAGVSRSTPAWAGIRPTMKPR